MLTFINITLLRSISRFTKANSLILSFILPGLFSKGQVTSISDFEYYLAECNLSFEIPANYVPLKDSLALKKKRGRYKIGDLQYQYALKHDKKDIIICVLLSPITPSANKATHDFIIKSTPDADINALKYVMVAGKDTLSGPFTYNNPQLLKSTNAHKSMEGPIYLFTPFFDNYPYAKGVTIQRNWKGVGVLYYFYNYKSARTIDKEIRRTRNSLKFLPDSQFKLQASREKFKEYYSEDQLSE